MSELHKIVMIDDEKDLCFGVKDNLESMGNFAVATLCDPNQAEDFIRAEKPDLILLDVVMPGRTGPDIIEALGKDEELKKIPIIVVSGKGEMVYNKKRDEFKWLPNSKIAQDRDDLPEGKGAEALAEAYGVVDYISKPFTTDLLVSVLEEVLAKYKKSSDDEDMI